MSGKGESAAHGLLVRMLPFKFIASCLILKSFFSLSRCISKYLQYEDMDLVSAVSGIQSLKDTLSSFRNDVKLDGFLSKAKEFCEQSEVDVVKVGQQSRPERQRTLPSYFRDGSVLLDQDALILQTDPPRQESMAYLFKTNFYYSLLDRLQNELEKRFSSKACEILSFASVFHPKHLTAENATKAEKITNCYGINGKQVENQFTLLSNSADISVWKKEYRQHFAKNAEKNVANQKPWSYLPTFLQVFSKNDLHILYPELFEVVRVVATLPVTVHLVNELIVR